MQYVRCATAKDLPRIAEMVVFNYRLNFYPIFQNDEFYFDELSVIHLVDRYADSLDEVWVYDDGVVKGFIQVKNQEIKKLFVEPVLQGQGIGSALLTFAIHECDARYLWALEKNVRAIRFYEGLGFCMTTDKKLEEDTTEYLVRLERKVE